MRFRKTIKGLLLEPDILDVILFGSVVRGKEEPSDIDVLILYSSKVDENKNYELRKRLEKEGFKFHILSKTYKQLFDPNFLGREAILTESYSLKLNNFLSNLFGFHSFTLFRYYLDGLSNSQRMKFYYALYGRGKEEGILKKFESVKFSDKLIISPVEKQEEIKTFFEKKGIKFDKFEILIPKRISKKRFLEAK